MDTNVPVVLEKKVTQFTICNNEDGLCDEDRIVVSLYDDGDGEYVQVHQPGRYGDGNLSITADQWSIVQDAIDELLS